MDLLDHWVVGFSGKRRLPNPEAVRSALRQVLAEVRDLSNGQLVAISSIAIGADLLFVAESTRAGLPWICVLPFPEEDFFNERDFPDATERAAAREKIREAIDCEVVRLPRTPHEVTDSTWRRAAFAEAGFRSVDEADIVITVLDDGSDAGKPGGTSDVLAYARARNRPLAIIDPETAQVLRENWPARMHDRLTERLRCLPGVKLSEKECARIPTPGALRVAEWRSAFGRAARKQVPGIRWATTAVVVLHALATIITACVFLLLPADERFHTLKQSLEITAFVFVLTGFIFLGWLLWKGPHKNAANYRLAAEIGRSILATWSIPQAAAQVLRGAPGEFMHLARTLLLQQRTDPAQPRALDHLSPDAVNALASAYLDDRIESQIRYFNEKCLRARRAAHIIEATSILLSLIAVVSAGVLALGVETHRYLWAFTKLAAATAAPVMVSILIIHEIKRREARYKEMETSLRDFAQRLGHVRSPTALRDLVVDVERMLLSECHDWWVLAKANVAA